MIAITAFFAPPDQKVRKRNFDVFRKHLGIPLIVVEWSSEGFFHVSENECEHLIQLRSGDRLWQKEALLNIGIRKAKQLGYDKVALLDADIVFQDQTWYKKVEAKLNTCAILQCFHQAFYLMDVDYFGVPRADFEHLPVALITPSMAQVFSQNQKKLFAGIDESNNPLSKIGSNMSGNPGLAYAINLKNFSCELYDANIVGAGDLILFAVLNNQLDELFSGRPVAPNHKSSIEEWSKTNEVLGLGCGYSDLRLFHLWHGDSKTRNYQLRWEILSSRNYNPSLDITHNSQGLLEFTSFGERLITAVGDYMSGRKKG